jgi:hypothetical protein
MIAGVGLAAKLSMASARMARIAAGPSGSLLIDLRLRLAAFPHALQEASVAENWLNEKRLMEIFSDKFSPKYWEWLVAEKILAGTWLDTGGNGVFLIALDYDREEFGFVYRRISGGESELLGTGGDALLAKLERRDLASFEEPFRLISKETRQKSSWLASVFKRP